MLVAGLLGMVIGAEREFRGHPAGLRTMTVVSIGSCLFTVAGVLVPHTDPTRVAAQVVTGVGFLGAGAILRDGASIHGLTTAAAIWVVAALGMAVGFGLFLGAAAVTVVIIVFLVGLKPLERMLHRAGGVREPPTAPPPA